MKKPPVAVDGAIKFLRRKGHSIEIRELRSGDLRYSIGKRKNLTGHQILLEMDRNTKTTRVNSNPYKPYIIEGLFELRGKHEYLFFNGSGFSGNRNSAEAFPNAGAAYSVMRRNRNIWKNSFGNRQTAPAKDRPSWDRAILLHVRVVKA